MANCIALVTIGQAPRTDIVPEMQRVLGEGVGVVEAGALDGLGRDGIAQLAPRRGDYVLVTRLANGSGVPIAKHKLLPRLRRCIADASARDVRLVILLCTGEFPEFQASRLVIRPDRVLEHAVRGILPHGRLGVVVPSPSQTMQARKRWSHSGLSVLVETLDPYRDGRANHEAVAERLAKRRPDLVVLDCIGYDRHLKRVMHELTQAPVLLAHSVVARVVRELLPEP